jgi:hypothetical protein
MTDVFPHAAVIVFPWLLIVDDRVETLVNGLVGGFAFTPMQRDILIDIRTCATSQHPPHSESGRCLPGFKPGHSVCGCGQGCVLQMQAAATA